MRRMRRASTLIALFAAAAVALSAAGCGAQPKKAQLQPKVSPPAIREAGTLKAGVDIAYPPFGGTDSGQQAGIDVDVAGALAERLGLKLTIVPVKASDAATALADGSADVVLSVPFSDEAVSNVSLAGSYISDAPGFFVASDGTASAAPTLTIVTLPPPPAQVGVQMGSQAFWRLTEALGARAVKPYPTLRAALDAVSRGGASVAAGDALVGAYIARDYPNIRFAGQMEPAVLLGVAVTPDNAVLGDAVRSALDGLAADGVFDTIRVKWAGNLARLEAAKGSSTTTDTTPSAAP